MDVERHDEDPYPGSADQVVGSMSQPLEIEGAVSINHSNLAVSIRADGREVVCDLPNLSSGWALLRMAQQAHVFTLPWLAVLSAADLRLSIRLGGRVVAEAGPGIAPGRLAGWLGLSGLRLRSFKVPTPC